MNNFKLRLIVFLQCFFLSQFLIQAQSTKYFDIGQLQKNWPVEFEYINEDHTWIESGWIAALPAEVINLEGNPIVKLSIGAGANVAAAYYGEKYKAFIIRIPKDSIPVSGYYNITLFAGYKIKYNSFGFSFFAGENGSGYLKLACEGDFKMVFFEPPSWGQAVTQGIMGTIGALAIISTGGVIIPISHALNVFGFVNTCMDLQPKYVPFDQNTWEPCSISGHQFLSSEVDIYIIIESIVGVSAAAGFGVSSHVTTLDAEVLFDGISIQGPLNSNEPIISVVPEKDINFEEILIGTNESTTITVNNIGGGTLTGSLSILNNEDNAFQILGDNQYSLGAGQSKNVDIQFNPILSKSYSCEIKCKTDGRITTTASRLVKGIGKGPTIKNSSNTNIQPQVLKPNDSFTMNFEIESPFTSPRAAWLGATIFYHDDFQFWYSDSDRDEIITLQPGINQYSREFVAPVNFPLGSYDVVYGIHSGNIIGQGDFWHQINKKSLLTIENPSDNSPPTINSINHNSSVSTNIEVVFSEDINQTTLNGNTIIVTGSNSGIHNCSFSYNESAKALTINPDTDFSFNENVQIILTTAITDIAGNGIDGNNDGVTGPNYVYSFATGSFNHDFSVNNMIVSNSNPVVGEEVSTNAIVRNIGSYAEGSGQSIEFYVDGIKSYTRYTTPLNPGDEYLVDFNWVATNGTHILKIESKLINDENPINNSQEISIYVGVASNLLIDGESNPNKNITTSANTSGEYSLILQNDGSSPISGSVTKTGSYASWISLTGGTSINLNEGATTSYIYYVSVPSGTPPGYYNASIVFNYNGSKSSIVSLNIQVFEPSGEPFTDILNSETVYIDGCWKSDEVHLHRFNNSSSFNLDNDPNTSYIHKSELFRTLSQDEYHRLNFAEWSITAYENKPSSTRLVMGVKESGESEDFSSDVVNGKYKVLDWFSNGLNTMRLYFNFLIHDNADVEWHIEESRIALIFSQSAWGTDYQISQSNLETWKSGWDIGKLYFDVVNVNNAGDVVLYNYNEKVDTRSISSSDNGNSRYFVIESDELTTSNHFIIRGDNSDCTKANIKNIRLEIKYFTGNPNLECTKSLSATSVQVNDNVTVNLSLKNVGTNMADDPTYNDSPLPEGIAHISGSLSDNLNYIDPSVTKTVSYIIRPNKPGTYTFGATMVTYKDQSGNNYQSTFNAVSLNVSGGNLMITGSIDNETKNINDTVKIIASVKESIGNTNINDAIVTCNIKNLTTNTTYQSFYLIYNESSGYNKGTFDKTQDDGEYEIRIIAERQFYNTGNLSSPLTFTVLPPSYIEVVPNSKTVSHDTGSTSFNINSNVNWEVVENEDWLELININETTIQINYVENNSVFQRTGIITISSSEAPNQVFTLIQEGVAAYLEVTPNSLTIGDTSGIVTFNVASNVNWNVQENVDWLTAFKSDSITITISFFANESVERNTSIVVIGPNVDTVTLSITQESGEQYLFIDQELLMLADTTGSNGCISVSSNVSWTASPNQSWLGVSPQSGSNDGTVTVTANSENTSTSSRTAIVTVSGEGITKTVTVTQEGTQSDPCSTIFEEYFNNIDGWAPALNNGANCSWTTVNGWAKIESMGYNPVGWISAIYEKDLPQSIPPGVDFVLKAYIRVMDGDPSGACSGVGVNMVDSDGNRMCRINFNDSQAATGYGGLQYSTGLGMVYTNDPNGFSTNNPTLDGLLEIKREDTTWTAYLDGQQLGLPHVFDVQTTATRVQITNGKYKTYGYRDGEIDYIYISTCVNETPVLELGGPYYGCEGDVIILDAGDGFQTYQWNTGATTQTIEVVQTGTYIVSVTDQDNTEFTDTAIVVINPYPDIDLGGPYSICIGESITLDAGSGHQSYLWSTGESTSSIVVVPLETTTYQVTVDNDGCPATEEVTVIVFSVPVANAGEDQTICEGESVTLTATGGETYEWNTGATIASITVSPVETTTYEVTVTSNGCSSTDEVIVTVNPLPIANAGEDQSICEGESITLFASGGSAYLWSTGETTQSITVSPEITIEYFVTVTENSCSATDSVRIGIDPLPIINLGNDTTITTNDTIILDPGEGFVSYLWNNGITDQTLSIIGSEIGVGNYNYSATVTDNNTCSNSDTIKIFIEIGSGLNKLAPKPTIKLYPNPTTGILYIVFNKTIEDELIIDIFNNLGLKIFNRKLENVSDGEILEIDLANKHDGIYLIKVLYKDKIFVRKILKN